MKFLVMCICAHVVAASSAGKLNAKRGIFGSSEADDATNNYVVETHGFNDASNGGLDCGSQYNDCSSNSNHIGSSYDHFDFHPSPPDSSVNAGSYSSETHSNFNNEPTHGPEYENFPPNDNHQYGPHSFSGGSSQSYDSSGALAGPSLYAAPVHESLLPNQNFDKPHEIVQTHHSESIERGQFPVHVPRTIVKTIHIEHPVPQPYKVVKHVPQPYPINRVRTVVKEVKVPQPYFVSKEIVKQVPVERLIPKPVPIVRYVHEPVEHRVPVWIQSPHVYHAPIAHHSVAHHSTYGHPHTYRASYAHAPISHAHLPAWSW